MASKGKRKGPVCCTRCPLKVAGLRTGTKKLASAALDEEMPWRPWTFDADTQAGLMRVAERTWDIVRASSFPDCKAVADNGALPYHHVLH